MNFGIPQIIYITLAAMGLGIDLIKHGETKSGKHNVVTTLIAQILVLGLLYWGGFFK